MRSSVTVIREGKIYILDLAAKLDQCAEYLCKAEWGEVEYPAPFGREAYPEVSQSTIHHKSRSYLSHTTIGERQCLCLYFRRPTSRNWTGSRERLSNSPY